MRCFIFGSGRLVLHQLQPDIPLYNESILFRLTGKLIALEQSLNEIIRRHEILRTRFQVVEGQPCKSSPHLTLTLPDLQEIRSIEQETKVKQVATQDLAIPSTSAEDTTAGHPAAVERGACHALDHASHYLRWLVGKSSSRASSTLPSFLQRVHPASTADSVCRFCTLAAVKWRVRTSLAYGSSNLTLPQCWDCPQTIRLLFKLSVAREKPDTPQPLTGALKSLSQQEGKPCSLCC